MSDAPQRTSIEGAGVAQAWAVQHGTPAHLSYSVLHPPLGWVQLAAWNWSTGAPRRAPNAIAAGREFMLVLQLISVVLLWLLARRLAMTRWAATIAVALFGLSPLAVHFHRSVFVDNVGTPWVLAAFVLALTTRGRRASHLATGACFGIAVLSKETSLLLLPALGWLIWRSTDRAIRRSALMASGSVFAGVVVGYLAYVAVTGDGAGGMLSTGSTGSGSLSRWLDLDTVTPLLALAAAAAAAVAGSAIPRLRPIALAFALPATLLLRPGHLPLPMVITLIPFAALLVAGVADWAWAWQPRVGRHAARRRAPGRWSVRPLLVPTLVVAVVAGAFAAPAWADHDRELLGEPADQPMRRAADWMVENVPAGERLIVDDALWLDLVRRKFPTANVVWFDRLDKGPAVGRSGGDRSRYDVVVSSRTTRALPKSFPRTRAALRHSALLARFGSGDDRVEVRRIVSDRSQDTLEVQGPPPTQRPRSSTFVRAGEALAQNRSIVLAPRAKDQLVRGEVDGRLMTILAALAVQRPFTVDAFPADSAGPAVGGAGRSLLTADLTIPGGPAGSNWVVSFLQSQSQPFRPAQIIKESAATGGRSGTLRLSYLPAPP